MVTDIQSCHVDQRKKPNQGREGDHPRSIISFSIHLSIIHLTIHRRLSIQPCIHASIHYLSSIYLPTYLSSFLPSFLLTAYLSVYLSSIYRHIYRLSVCLFVCILNTLGYYLAQKQPGSEQWFREQNVPAQG